MYLQKMAQTLPQRKLLLAIIFDPMHRLSSNMTQNELKVQYLQACIKKCACMHMHMHMQMHNTKTNYLHYGLMGCHFRKQKKSETMHLTIHETKYIHA